MDWIHINERLPEIDRKRNKNMVTHKEIKLIGGEE